MNMLKHCALDKGIMYSNRVRLGNWYEATQLEEYKLTNFLERMKGGDLMLAKYRIMEANLKKPTVLTQAAGAVNFGAKISLYAPHVPSQEVAEIADMEVTKGVQLAGRITSNEINRSQELVDGCQIIATGELKPMEKTTFTIMSADYCDRNHEPLKFNQEFLLAVSNTLEKDKTPLYIRYDPNAVPGLNGMFPLYLSEHPVSNTRWRVLPVQKPNITRFEQEGQPVPINTDIVINHCATNTNLGINTKFWTMGFWGRVCAPLMRTNLDIYGRELPDNIMQIYSPIDTVSEKE